MDKKIELVCVVEQKQLMLDCIWTNHLLSAVFAVVDGKIPFDDKTIL
jgi:hypothetical protein